MLWKLTLLSLGMRVFTAKDEHVQLWKWTLLVLETNLFSAKTNEANAFGVEDEITCLALETNTFSAKDRRRLKENAFGTRERVWSWR